MSTTCQRLPLPDGAPSTGASAALGEALESGGLVGLPTESGYVLAGRADDPTLRAAVAARAPQGEPTSLVEALSSSAELPTGLRLRPLLDRLVARYWPGPLALRALDGGGEVRTFRSTAHAGTRGLVERARRALVWTRAAGPDGGTLTDADAVARAHGDALSLLFDGGPTRLAEPAAVLRVTPGSFVLEREGLLPIEDLRATAGLRIGFICTGNTCRSPMAEALARAELARRLGTEDRAQFGFQVLSAGVFAGAGGRAAEHAVTAMADRGLDLSAHASRPAAPELIAALDRAYCLTRSHLEALRMALPPGRAGHVELLDPEGADVPDPVGGSLDAYRECAQTIERAVALRASSWA